MGNTHVKPHPRSRNKKQVHWKAAVRPSPPGKPSLVTDNDFIPDVVTIRWPRPVNDGGSPITGYLVEHRRTDHPHWIRSNPTLVQEPELSISGLEPGWRYQFRVRAENAVGLSEPGDLSEPLTLTLQRSAIIPPRFTQELVDTVALENEKAEFVVHFLGQPTPRICWYKDGFEIFSSRRTRIITENGRSTLTIHQSALSDEGEIKCTATNRAGHASTKSKLTLEAPPSIRLPRQYEDGLLFEMGEMMRLKVSVAGRPTPLLFWYHNGEPLHNSDRYEMTYSERSSILKIEEAQRSDRGEYQVRAVNKIGEDTASFLVTVTDKPSPPGKARVVMTLGRSVTLSWETPKDDGGCKIGNYIIEYYRVGWNVWLKAATSRQLTTVLGDLIEGSEYKFRVKAESPYGVSDPSEETETIFIPDPKRGILTPERSRSQPRDIVEEVLTPVAARRKNKSKSASNSRAQTPQPVLGLNIPNEAVPVRPQRTKSKTPQTSPRAKRKEFKTTINSEIFDRSSMAREMAYGSPEIKVKKAELEPPQNDYLLNYSSGSDKSDRSVRSRSPSPFVEKPKTQERRISIYSIENLEHPPPSPVQKEPTPPRFTYEEIPPTIQRRLSRQHSENLTGSSEFMLVLYPDGNDKDHKREGSHSFDFGDELIPPPLSLSAPELGTEPPPIGCLRHAVSSTELLHERAIQRFYQVMQAEEEENAKREEADERRQSIIPKIQINSQDESDIISRGDFNSLRRRKSLSAVGQKRALWAQRRHSLRGPNDIMEVVEEKLGKSSHLSKTSLERQKSIERQETSPESMRSLHLSHSADATKKVTTSNRPEQAELGEEYEESLSESEDESDSEDERLFEQNIPSMSINDQEEEETYNPRMKTPLQISTKNQDNHNSEEPFEILTVRKEPPSPDFKPKPILKKVENEEIYQRTSRRQQSKENQSARTRTHSPMPPFKRSISLKSQNQTQTFNRERSASLVTTRFKDLASEEEVEEPKPETSKISDERKETLLSKLKSAPLNPKLDRSASLIIEEPVNKSRQRSVSLTTEILKQDHTVKAENKSPPTSPSPKNVSAAAAVSGFAAASIVIPKELLKKKAEEETKVLIDHYVDILSNYNAQKKKMKNGSLEINTSETPSAVTNPKIQQETPILHTATESSNLKQNAKTVLQGAPSDDYEPTLEEVMSAKPYGITYESNKQKLEQKKDIVDQVPLQKALNSNNYGVNTENTKAAPPGKTESSKTPRMNEKIKKTSSSRSSSKSRRSGRSSSNSPHRLSNWSNTKGSASVGHQFGRKSPSPVPQAKRHPKMKEIMTQTSIGLELNTKDYIERQEQLLAKAEVKVRSTVDYLTDLAMFAVACWLYLHNQELLSIPVLLFMVYRQLAAEIYRWIPKWILRRLKRRKENQKT